MSDTDDTDDLLLIPPDLFVVNSEFAAPYSSAPYYNIVDTLITQVNKLEDRINFIVSTSDVSAVSNFLDTIHVSETASMSRERNYHENVERNSMNYISSTQSTPQKPRTIFKVNSLPQSPAVRKFCRVKDRKTVVHSQDDSSESQENQTEKIKLLNEIDDFIYNVKSNNRLNVSRNLEQDFNGTSSSNYAKRDNALRRGLNLHDVDQLLGDMEKRQLHLENSTLKNVKRKDERFHNDYIVGKEKGLSNRYNAEENNINMLTATSMSETVNSDISTFNSESIMSDNTVVSSSDSTQVTAFQNVNQGAPSIEMCVSNAYGKTIDAIKMHQQMLCHSQGELPNNALQNQSKNAYHPDNNMQLLSLTDLWGRTANDGDGKGAKSKFMGKLEEERLRRKHCEEMIHNLQQKILEFQEKLAVAIEVDQSKDEAILKFHDAWEKVAVRLEALTKDKVFLERDLQGLHAKSAIDLAEAAKKVAYYEAEASKALTAARSNQEQLANLEKQCTHSVKEINALQKKLEEAQKASHSETEKNKQLSELIAKKELDLHEKQGVLSDARKEVAQSRKSVEVCQAEFTSMKTRFTQLELQFNDAKDYIADSEKQRKKLQQEIDTHKKIEKDLQDELNKSKEQNEKNKLELRNFYQDQVEVVVRDKLQEFQEQLERAEKSMQEEIKNRELTVAKTAAQHIQQIQEKHTLEVQLLEEKRHEEVRLYQLKLNQAHKEIEVLQSKFREQHQRRAHIAQELHKVMEAQWLEALKILNARTPSSPDLSCHQLNALKSKSYGNLEELIMANVGDAEGAEARTQQQQHCSDTRIESNNFLVNKYASQNAFRLPDDSTPLSSRGPRNRQQIENELHKYVQMLLPKPSELAPDPENPTSDRAGWFPAMAPEDYKSGRSSSSKDRRLNKQPPWK